MQAVTHNNASSSHQTLAGLGDIAEDSSPPITQPQQPQLAQQLASSPDLPPPAWASMSSARVLDTAMRTYVMMSQLHSRGSEGHTECCLAALGCCCLLWKVQSARQLHVLNKFVYVCTCMLYTAPTIRTLRSECTRYCFYMHRTVWTHVANLLLEGLSMSLHHYRSGAISCPLMR